MKHPYFSNPMIYLPLVLMGIEKIYKKEKPHLFICATAVAAMSNFYFFYYDSVSLWCCMSAFRYFGIFRRRSVKDVFQWFLKFAGFYLVASYDRCTDLFTCGHDSVWNRALSGAELCAAVI